MREILVRAYDKTMKRYKPFDGMHDTMTISREGKVEYYNLQNGSGFDEYILEQFTGFIDKNGKKIFEGDILLCFAEGQQSKEIVEYSEYGWLPFIKQTGDLADAYSEFNYSWFEIIGNIHDNPELLP